MAASSTKFAAVLAAVALAAGCGVSGERGADVYSVRVGSATALVEVASTPEARAIGLSARNSLAPGHGMLFVFPSDTDVPFWMKDTHVPLSIAFIAADGRIAEIQDMAPDTLEKHAPGRPARMALEMPAGWFAENGVTPGDVVSLPAELAGARAR